MKDNQSFSVREYKDQFCQRSAEVAAGKTHFVQRGGQTIKISPVHQRPSPGEAIQRILDSQVKGKVNLSAAIQEGRL